MKVCILASLEQERDILHLARNHMQKGNFVIYPFLKTSIPRHTIFIKCLRNIDSADEIIVLTKFDGSIGDGVAYEMAFAGYLGKPIQILRPNEKGGFTQLEMDPTGLLKETKLA